VSTVAPTLPLTLEASTSAPTDQSTGYVSSLSPSVSETVAFVNELASTILSAESAPSDQFALPRPQIVANDQIFDVYPLTECLGDCDTDDDCAEGLRCFQRRGSQPIPGCDPSQNGEFGADYCVKAEFVSMESSEHNVAALYEEDEEQLEDEAWENGTHLGYLEFVDGYVWNATLSGSGNATQTTNSSLDPTAALNGDEDEDSVHGFTWDNSSTLTPTLPVVLGALAPETAAEDGTALPKLQIVFDPVHRLAECEGVSHLCFPSCLIFIKLGFP